MNKRFKIFLICMGILALAGLIVTVMYITRAKPAIEPVEAKPTPVETIAVEVQTQTFRVRTQGTVEPLRETVLIPEVSGRIVTVSPAFQAGGFFEQGDVLLEIDPGNYEAAVAQADYNVEQARLALEQEVARAEQARKEWQSLGKGEAPPLAVREPQLRSAQANVRWAEEALARARRDLERTKIRAPYAGMVREKRADLGQYVSPGTQLGTVFAIDVAEVRLPLSTDDLAYLDLPHAYRGDPDGGNEPPVALRARIAGETHTWEGRVVRTEGTINPSNRMIYAVARVNDPYGRRAGLSRPPLTMGLFVAAEIEGRTVENVVVLPRPVLRGADRVLVVDEASTELRTRPVEVLKADEKQVIISEGLQPGELVCTTALEFVVEGMKVELLGHDAAPAEGSPPASEVADTAKPDAEGGSL